MTSTTPTKPLTTLQLIAQCPIVSSGTLRPEDVIPALIDEHSRLGIDYPQDWLVEIEAIRTDTYDWDYPLTSDLWEDLMNNIHCDAPSGCYLAAHEGDGALLMWHMDIEAQAQLLRDNGFDAFMETIPEHWLPAIVNCDESSFDLSEDRGDYQAFQQFCEDVGEYSITTPDNSESYFGHHDYGLPGTVVDVICFRRLPAKD